MQLDPESEPASSAKPPVEVTIVAHDIGSVGGMERQLLQLIEGLRRLGHEVTVIARVCELAPDSGVRFRRVPGPKRPFLLAYPWFLLAGTLAVRRWRVGVVQTTGAIVLNRVDATAVHYCHHAGIATPSRATRLTRLYMRAVAQLNRALERLCYGIKSPRALVCVSDGVADELRRYFPAAAGRVRTIHNGVDLSAFAPGARLTEARELRARLGIPAERRVAAFVGSEWERKGLEPAIRALVGAPGWDLVVAGGGDRERYEQLAVRLGVERSVHWLGVTRDVPLVMALAEALVFPSSYEAFPLVALEAAASGLAILATPVNGVRELIADGESGLLIEQDPRSIAAALQRLAENPMLLERMGAAARAAVLEFSWERMVLGHHELYEELAAS